MLHTLTQFSVWSFFLGLIVALICFLAAPRYTRWSDSRTKAKADARAQADVKRRERIQQDADRVRHDPVLTQAVIARYELNVERTSLLLTLTFCGAVAYMLMLVSAVLLDSFNLLVSHTAWGEATRIENAVLEVLSMSFALWSFALATRRRRTATDARKQLGILLTAIETPPAGPDPS